MGTVKKNRPSRIDRPKIGLSNAAFYAKALLSSFQAGLLAFPHQHTFPAQWPVAFKDADIFLRLTVARQPMISTRFPFHSIKMEHLNDIEYKERLPYLPDMIFPTYNPAIPEYGHTPRQTYLTALVFKNSQSSP